DRGLGQTSDEVSDFEGVHGILLGQRVHVHARGAALHRPDPGIHSRGRRNVLLAARGVDARGERAAAMSHSATGGRGLLHRLSPAWLRAGTCFPTLAPFGEAAVADL